MSDEPTLGELWRRQRDHEERSERAHESLSARIDYLAAHTVPLGEYQTAERARSDQIQRMEKEHDEDMGRVSKRLEKQEGRSGATWGWVIAGLTLAIGVISVLIEAWSAAKGAK